MIEDKIYNSWLAGFWEGEGCLSRFKGHTGYRVTICQSITDGRKVISCMKKIQKKFGGRLYRVELEGKKDQMKWYLHQREDLIYFLKKIYPYCQFRKKQIRDALEYYENHPRLRKINGKDINKWTLNIKLYSYK